MVASTKNKPEQPRMSRTSWELQKSLGELKTWLVWSQKTLEGFNEDLTKRRTGVPRLPSEDVANVAVVSAEIDKILKAMKGLDSPLHKARQTRIRESKG